MSSGFGRAVEREPSFDQTQDYLPSLKAVFFARWDEDKGCEISDQIPEHSIGVTSTAPTTLSPTDYHHRHRDRHRHPHQVRSTGDDHNHIESSQSNDQISLIDSSPQSCHHDRPAPNIDSKEEDPKDQNQSHQQEVHSKFLFEFTEVIDFILPKKHLCGHLVTITSGSTKILGFPTLIEDEQKYERNFFMFNLCFVFDKDSELLGYEPIVRKTGRALRSLEEKKSLLSAPNNSTFEIKSILKQLFEELNSFSEVSISLHYHQLAGLGRRSEDLNDNHDKKDGHEGHGTNQEENLVESSHENLQEQPEGEDRVVSATSAIFLLNLKLFPFYGNPPEVYDWNVPISLVSFSESRPEISWDLTMYKLVPFIDGTATVRKISRLADVDIYLARECVQHLVYFGCCIISDPFRFSNSYKLIGAKTLNRLGDSNDLESVKLQEEFRDYIHIPSGLPTPPSSQLRASANQHDLGRDCDDDQEEDRNSHLQFDHNEDVDELLLLNNELEDYHSAHSIPNLLNLYNEFKSGITVHDWMEQNQVHKLNIDVRRFISFGTIKGFLKRLNCYPIWTLHPDLYPQTVLTNDPKDPNEDDSNRRSVSLSRVTTTFSQKHQHQQQRRHPHHPHSTHFINHRSSSSIIRPPVWLTVLKRLNHPHSLTSHPLDSKLGRDIHQLLDDDSPISSSSHSKKSNHKKSTSKRSSFVPDHHHSYRPHSSSHLYHSHPSRHHHHHHISQQYDHHHYESIAVQVPKDLPLKLNGFHHLDEICVQFRISLIQLEQILRYIDTLSLEELSSSIISNHHHPSSSLDLTSTIQTIYY